MTIASRAVHTYVALVVASLVALVVLSLTRSREATSEAWVHTVIVAALALLLPLRMRSARAGNVGAVRAVGIIAAVLFVVNVVEAQFDTFPVWLRVQMAAVAVLMLVVVGGVITDRVRAASPGRG